MSPLKFYKSEKVALFIDGANLFATARALGFDIDYKRLQEFFSSECALIRSFYYTALVEDQEYSPIRPLVDWLDYNGYTMVTKPTKEFTDSTGRRKIKGNMDIELAIDVMEMAAYVEHIVLFSGDGELRSQPSMIADELRRQADVFIDLEELRGHISREHGERGAPRPQRPVSPDPHADDDFDDDEYDDEYEDEDEGEVEGEVYDDEPEHEER
jgi:uncharacterized LabA/DUF88 family protein